MCGTLNYAARTILVAVNVALRTGSGTTVAACADPFTHEVFWTAGGQAYVRRDGVDEELRPSAGSRLVDVNLDPPFPNSPRFRAVRLLTDTAFGERFRPRVVSTTLAVAWVAAGRRAAYVTDGDLRDSVHFASGLALCRAAGCVVTGIHGQPLHTGAGGLVVAADQVTHATLLALIGDQFRSEVGSAVLTRDRVVAVKPGDIYEDCAFHPVLCTDIDGDEIRGISLVDASTPRACSISHCGVVTLSVHDVIAARADWSTYLTRRKAEFDAGHNP